MPCGTSGSSVVVEFRAVLKENGVQGLAEHVFFLSFSPFFLFFLFLWVSYRNIGSTESNLLHRHRLWVHGGIILVGPVRSY